MRRTRYLLAVSLLVGAVYTSSPAKEINSDAGTSAFSFLKINVGARPVGMGGAFTGVANDESALYYNPAGIACIENSRYVMGYHNYFVDLQSGFLGAIFPVSDGKSLAGFVSYLNYGEMIETDDAGNVLGEFGGGDWLFGVTFAISHRESFQFGATAKLIYEKLHDYSASGIAFDLGVRYGGFRERYTAGIMLQNFGSQFSSLGEEKEGLPTTLRGGIAARPKGLPVLFSGDVIMPFDNDLEFAIGGEYYELEPFYVRLGWNSFGSNYQAQSSDDDWAGMSVGIGFDIKNLGVLKNAHLSYAYSPAADLGESHRITLTGGR